MMIHKLLFHNQDKRQLFIAVTGAFLGLTFLTTSLHYMIKLNEFGTGTDILGPNTLVVQKKVTNSSSLNLSKTDFSESEIKKIKKEPFIVDAQAILSNNFEVSFETADPMVPRFRTDVFIQTVNPKFLDIKSKTWRWHPNDNYVPIIMPREFLVMLNTFMAASGIPQISDDLAMDIKFKFKLKDESKNEYVNARISGFTNEVSSILVPESFMEYGNKRFNNERSGKITQLMISGKEGEFGNVEELLQKRGLESKHSQLLIGRLKSVVGTLFSMLLGISIIAVFLAGLVLIQYMQLLMSQNSYAVRTLLSIGYLPSSIIGCFFRYFITVFAKICFASFTIFFIVKYFLDNVFESGGLYLNTELSFIAISALLLIGVLFGISSYQVAKKNVFKAC